MKPNIFLILIAIVLTALFSFSVYSYSVESKRILSTVIFSFTFLVYIGMLLGYKMEYDKAQVLKNTVSILFIIFSAIVTLFYLRIDYSIPLYLLINIVPLLIYAAVVNGFAKAKF